MALADSGSFLANLMKSILNSKSPYIFGFSKDLPSAKVDEKSV